MKKLSISLVAVFCSGLVFAQSYECQKSDSVGFHAQPIYFKRAVFEVDPQKLFQLQVVDGLLTKQSVGKALEAFEDGLTCKAASINALNAAGLLNSTVLSCVDRQGLNMLTWSPESGNGSMVNLTGSVQRINDMTKDSIRTTLFACRRK
jgi:hypothetical protein